MDNKKYKELIKEDLKWLNKQPRTLERDHIQNILQYTIDQIARKGQTGAR